MKQNKITRCAIAALIMTCAPAFAAESTGTNHDTSVDRSEPATESNGSNSIEKEESPPVIVDPGFESPKVITKRTPVDWAVGIYDFTVIEGIDQSEERLTPAATVSGPSGAWAMAPVHFPEGKTLSSMILFGTHTSDTGGMIMELRRKRLESNEIDVLATITSFKPSLLMVDLDGNPLWGAYSGSFATAYEHIYDDHLGFPTIVCHTRTVSTEMDHGVNTGDSYYLYLYTTGTVVPEEVQFWSAGFTFE